MKNLKNLASMVESCNDEFLRFDLEYQQVFHPSPLHIVYLFGAKFSPPLYSLIILVQIVVLRTKTAKAATLDILATHCIPSATSDDLKT